MNVIGVEIMLVYVNKKNYESYYTVLLAVKYAGWKTKVIYYDPIHHSIKMDKMWQSSNNYSKRAFYILKESKDWIQSKKWIGFDWIIREIEHLNIFTKNKFSLQSINTTKQLYENLIIHEWNEVKTIEDIENLKNVAIDFHDAYISKVENYNEYEIIDFNTTWGCHILLKVSDIEEIELNYPSDKNYDFFADSNIEIINNKLSFVFNAMFCDEQGNESVNKIICKSAFWKFVVSKYKNYTEEDD